MTDPIEELASLKYPKTCYNWKIVTYPRKIEHYLMRTNQLHFSQAHGTPFTTIPLGSEFD